MKIPSWLIGATLLVIIALSGFAGFSLGEKRGIKKGGRAGGAIAKIYLDADKDFKLLLVSALENDARPKSDQGIRDLAIVGLESYLPTRTLLAQEPFAQDYELFEEDQESINEALASIRAKTLQLEYKEGEQGAAANGGG